MKETALIKSTRNGHPDIVKLLIRVGGDIKAKNKNGETAISCAIDNNHYQIAVLLSQSLYIYKRDKKL